MRAIERTELYGLPLDLGLGLPQALARLAEGPQTLTYLNPRAWFLARRNPDYVQLLKQFDLVTCDGIAVQHAVKTALGRDTPILTPDFSGLADHLFRDLLSRGGKLCLVGGTEEVSRKASQRLSALYPQLKIVGGFPGYGDALTAARQHLLAQQPEVTLVAMGMYLQEQFVQSVRAAGVTGSLVCVGGFFDKLADPSREYSEWQMKHRVRFLAHLRSDPLRYLWRYGIEYQPFFWRHVAHKLSID